MVGHEIRNFLGKISEIVIHSKIGLYLISLSQMILSTVLSNYFSECQNSSSFGRTHFSDHT